MTRFKLLLFLSIASLLYLLVSTLLKIDFAASKNHALTVMNIQRIAANESINGAKVDAMTCLDLLEKERNDHSNNAIKYFWIILVLIIFQITLLWTNRNSPISRSRNHE
jgi:hypothetical protein